MRVGTLLYKRYQTNIITWCSPVHKYELSSLVSFRRTYLTEYDNLCQVEVVPRYLSDDLNFQSDWRCAIPSTNEQSHEISPQEKVRSQFFETTVNITLHTRTTFQTQIKPWSIPTVRKSVDQKLHKLEIDTEYDCNRYT
jgi:hypothetical protein